MEPLLSEIRSCKNCLPHLSHGVNPSVVVKVIYKLCFVYLLTLLISGHAQSQEQEQVLKVNFSTYFGGLGIDDADVVTVDLNGNTYLGGHSNSPKLPGITKYPYTLSEGMDAFVIKLKSPKHEVGYISHLGGSKWEAIQGLIADSEHNIYAIGTTSSPDFPISTNAFQATHGGQKDVFVVKLSPKGELLWSTFLGGSNDEDGRYISLDDKGKVYVVGWTASNDYPITRNALQSESSGGKDAFLSILDFNGKLLSSTYLGGTGDDIGFTVTLNTSGQICIGGTTNSENFPVKNALQANRRGGNDAFLAMIDTNQLTLDFATYWGGEGDDQLKGLDIDSNGNIFLMGLTHSLNFPVTDDAPQKQLAGGMDVFVSKLNLKNSTVVHSTYLGGNQRDRPRNFALDHKGNPYIVGTTTSDNFPTTASGNRKGSGDSNAFITLLSNKDLEPLYSSLYGGNGSDTFEGIAIAKDGSVIVSGLSSSTNFPLKQAIQNSFQGGRFDIIVVRFSSD